jgi:AraC family transcriptional regulator of arabinose operon
MVVEKADQHIRAILELIETGRLRTIQDLARRLELSDSRVKHLFKQQTGLSLGHVLTERRLRGAADLLTHTRMCIKEIAYTVGYKHTSSFIRAFERYFTCAPEHYRRKSSRPYAIEQGGRLIGDTKS